ncbi:MAG TPA: hypothetical protein VF263_05580 [Longimicrobiaceae bacterium]
MSGLTKAMLYRLSTGSTPTREEEIPVQFNPASLKLSLTAQSDEGQSRGRPNTQYTGNSATELAFDLVFDTADEVGADGGARSVREKTGKIEQFVLPAESGGSRQSPPRVEFEWGGLTLQGTISSLAIDFDLFAEDGKPLRAKMSVTIKEQDPKYALLQSGPGSATEANAPNPGAATPAAPGSSGGGASSPSTNRTGIALGGESAADFAVRMGLDAGAWRGLSAGLEGTLSLSAGLEIDFDASLSLSAGIGISAGFEADLGISLEASLGLQASVGVSAGGSAGASTSAGFALSAAGGVQASVETVRIAKAQAAAGATIAAFGATGVSASAALPTGGGSTVAAGRAAGFLPAATSTAAGAASGAAAAYSGAASQGAAAATVVTGTTTPSVSPADATSAVPSAYAPPRADPRAVGYGFGVPLRPRNEGAAQASAGVVALRPYSVARDTPVARDPTTPPWVQLPAASAPKKGTVGGTAAGRGSSGQGGGRTGCGCGCGPKGGAR